YGTSCGGGTSACADHEAIPHNAASSVARPKQALITASSDGIQSNQGSSLPGAAVFRALYKQDRAVDGNGWHIWQTTMSARGPRLQVRAKTIADATQESTAWPSEGTPWHPTCMSRKRTAP